MKPIFMGNKMGRMTVADRRKAGMGAVGPRHPAVRQMQMKGLMGGDQSSGDESEGDEPEANDNPQEEQAEPPNLRSAESCENCLNYADGHCDKFDYPVDPNQHCDEFEASGDQGDEGAADSDTSQGAETGGEY